MLKLPIFERNNYLKNILTHEQNRNYITLDTPECTKDHGRKKSVNQNK